MNDAFGTTRGASAAVGDGQGGAQRRSKPLRHALSARGLTAGYAPAARPPQIDDVSLTLVPGEAVAVIGPNGSGKTTLLRCLSRTLPPVRGAILLGEADLYAQVSPRESARAIAAVPQSSDVFLDFTVRDIVAMGRAPHRAGRGLLAGESVEDEAAVEAALARAGISAALAARSISLVSGGERQRALIARCLAQESPILLLDEPISALDLRHQRHLLAWLRALAVREKRSVLVVLHDLNAAAEFADRVVVMADGKIVADGAPDAVLTAELIRQVYGVPAWVRSNPATGRFSVLPALPGRGPLADGEQSGITYKEDAGGAGQSEPVRLALEGRRVHLFCGGGTGAALMFALAPLGASLSACALHEGDADLEAARALGVRHAAAPAFSRPGHEAAAFAQQLASGADAAVYTGAPFGEINAEMFEQLAAFAGSGRPLIRLGGMIVGGATEPPHNEKLIARDAEHAALLAARLFQEAIDPV